MIGFSKFIPSGLYVRRDAILHIVQNRYSPVPIHVMDFVFTNIKSSSSPHLLTFVRTVYTLYIMY